MCRLLLAEDTGLEPAGIFDVHLDRLRGEIDAEMSSFQEQLKYCIRTGIPL